MGSIRSKLGRYITVGSMRIRYIADYLIKMAIHQTTHFIEAKLKIEKHPYISFDMLQCHILFSLRHISELLPQTISEEMKINHVLFLFGLSNQIFRYPVPHK
jgi:hypothetical protein